MTHYNGCAAMKKKCLINAFSVLVLLAPRLWGQNPDELLVIRLPAKHGHINEPGAAPVPFPTVRGQIAVPGTDRRCKSMASGHSSVWCGDRNPSHAAGEGDFRRHCARREDKGRTGLAPEPKFSSAPSSGTRLELPSTS
jgi:hypothetical protein